jgi:hypothetical protein
MVVLSFILYFLNQDSNEGFTSLKSMYPTNVPVDASSLVYLIYFKKYNTPKDSIIDFSKNYLDACSKLGSSVTSERIKTFKTNVNGVITPYIKNPTGDTSSIISGIQKNFQLLNNSGTNISQTFKGGAVATKKDWETFGNGMFTDRNFLETQLSPSLHNTSANKFFYITDLGYNKILYDTTIDNATKVMNLANYINTNVVDSNGNSIAFTPLDKASKDRIYNEIVNWNSNLTNNVMSQYFNNTYHFPNISYKDTFDSSGSFNIINITDFKILYYLTSNDTADNITRNILAYVTPSTPPPTTTSGNNYASGGKSGNSYTSGGNSGNTYTSGGYSGNNYTSGGYSGNAYVNGGKSGNSYTSGNNSGNTYVSGGIFSNSYTSDGYLENAYTSGGLRVIT